MKTKEEIEEQILSLKEEYSMLLDYSRKVAIRSTSNPTFSRINMLMSFVTSDIAAFEWVLDNEPEVTS